MSDLVSRLLQAIEETEQDARSRNDPAAVLRRCAADRKIVDLCRGVEGLHEQSEADIGSAVLAAMVLEFLNKGYGISAEEETTGE